RGIRMGRAGETPCSGSFRAEPSSRVRSLLGFVHRHDERALAKQMSMARPRPVRGSATPTAVTYVGRDGLPAATSAPRSRRAVSANAEPVTEFAGRGVADTHFDQVARYPLYPLPERLPLVP